MYRLQFGHGGGAVENTPNYAHRRRSQNFNSATAVEPWRPRRRGAFDFTEIDFNSATAVEPWRTAPHRQPSTSPRRYFNSATAVEPWTDLAAAPRI